VIKTTCFLQDLSDFPIFNEVYATFFKGENPPARSTVEVAKLPMGVLVEIECVALVAGDR
jgi:enamine deaminase RidA (YjgF/YER057c/UK114 family)